MTEHDAMPETAPSQPPPDSERADEDPDSDGDDDGVPYVPLEATYAALADDSDDESAKSEGPVGAEGRDKPHTAPPPALPEPITINLEDNVKMSAEDAAAISSIMASFTLPESAIPEWAKRVPEDAWLPRVAASSGDTQSSTGR
ncbi:hypothetical protein HDU86_004179 [Geranomyces michiganensis]|nr:hypothetical protein HDU86_004179 [Geranomyces michiganensis]